MIDPMMAQPYCPLPLCEPVAQPVEHLTFNQGVAGSNPAGLTKRGYRLVESHRHRIFPPVAPFRIDRGDIMNRKLISFAILATSALFCPETARLLLHPASAACDPGEKPDKTTVEDTRKILDKAGYKKAHNWRKGCDNTWHVTASKDGVEVNVAVLADGHVVREGD